MCFDRGSLLADSPPTSHFARRTSQAAGPIAEAVRTNQTLTHLDLSNNALEVRRTAGLARLDTPSTAHNTAVHTQYRAQRRRAQRAPVARSRAVQDAHTVRTTDLTPSLLACLALHAASRFMVHASCVHTSCHVVCVMLRMSCCMRRASHGAVFMAAAGGGAVPAQRGARTQCLTHAPGAVGELGQGRIVGPM
jgi:hypothetical protein